MRAQEIRNAFSNYFIRNGHEKHKSSSLAPHNDPTILFANAGMNQFKDFFTGKAVPSHRRAVTIQKCVRAGGKHNDLENVGFTARHHTFFEMLGNFSFGDYFKKDAIRFAWELLTVDLKIPKDKLLVTVHDSDDEALEIWHKDMGVPRERIFKLGDKSNFWEMGDVGPCGPCTEIFYDHGPGRSTGVPAGHQEIDDEGRYVEIWNLVFMQFEKYKDGNEIKRKPLPKPSVDTGAGLERVAAVLQGKYFNYDTDIFEPIMKAIGKLTGQDYYTTTSEDVKSSFRVVADHIRSCTMLITDGVIPSNDGRGYVLRRIIRRAVRHLSLLGLKDISFYKLVPAVVESLGEEYPDNAHNAALAEKLLKLEEEKFRKTLDTGLALINEELGKLKAGQKLPGDVAFKLYDTFGFPLDLTEVILREKNLELDSKGFEEAMAKQKELSKKNSKFKVQEDNVKVFYGIKEKFGATKFTGYEEVTGNAKLLAKEEVDGQFYLVFDKTPFYGEGGGQVGDKGEIDSKEGKLATITDTQKPVDGLHVHISSDADALVVGESYTLKVNHEERELTKRNHSATHLLQSALIKVLGNHVKQAGSSVGPDRLRFDFTHNEAVKPEELLQVEELVNSAVASSLKVTASNMSKDEATKKGAMALFGEKYGDEVRVLEMGDFSVELCGGTHVSNTGEIGLFKIIVETSLASGVRRIEAITSTTAINYLLNRSKILAEVEKNFAVKEERVLEKLTALFADVKDKSKQIETLNDKVQSFESQNLFKDKQDIKGGLTLTIAKAASADQGNMRKLGDIFVEKFPQGVLFLYAIEGDKVSFIMKTNRANSSVNCSDILKGVMPIVNGRGGGKPDNAQGSGDAAKTQELIKAVEGALK
ncbi:alanine--tRNA ligase [Peredibacter starrii]|uniref:Alanine--tRNA ligase n=1 Tax=Peredibacter starrii TaxID=28202 RepID=A0AAX4HQI0_9BACT|nr:alanine--tRNA ligase [Peredibacter starrii]WPU65564.1 alanine--tRNA ligase [Peredibacter starrii]